MTVTSPTTASANSRCARHLVREVPATPPQEAPAVSVDETIA
jgi:hypothetical protein